MSLTLLSNAQLISSNIYLTNGLNQTGNATLSISPGNSFLLRYYYITQSNSQNTLINQWGDSNINLSLSFNQTFSNISLSYSSNVVLSNSSYPFTNSSNLVAIRQTLNYCKIYVNDVQYLNYSLLNDVNPTSGNFQWKGMSLNSSSNIITGINLDTAFTVSNNSEFLGDIKVSGEIVNVGIQALSNCCTVNYSNLNLLSNLNNSFSNDIYGRNFQNSNNFTNYSTSNIMFPIINFSSNASVYSSNQFPLYTQSTILSNTNFPQKNWSSNTAYWSSNNYSNYSYSNIVFPIINSSSNTSYWSSNYLSNVSTTINYSSNMGNSNLAKIIALSNQQITNYIYCSNIDFYTSNSTVFSSNSGGFASNVGGAFF
jgi:hypothetical protein